MQVERSALSFVSAASHSDMLNKKGSLGMLDVQYVQAGVLSASLIDGWCCAGHTMWVEPIGRVCKETGCTNRLQIHSKQNILGKSKSKMRTSGS